MSQYRSRLPDSIYRKELTTGKYLDPFNGFKEKEMHFEIRHDEITGVTCRIIPGRDRASVRPDINQYLEKNPTSACPFCPGLFEKITPKFTPDVIEEGKFQRGSAFLFPNAFPHSQFNCVAIFSDKHFLSLSELTADAMLDGFQVCLDYFNRMKDVSPLLDFCSVNWNYMPPAGGGLIHPHLQTVVSESSTLFVKKICEKAQNYQNATGGNLWRDVIDYEKEKDERYIASTGSIEWMVSFAPRGMLGEIWFIFAGKKSICSLNEDDLRQMLSGLSRIFGYFDTKNLISFNMGLFASFAENDNLYVQGRIIPRFVLQPLGTSDINYFEKIHDEIICPVMPEEMCKELKALF
jgi:UDPglucose--hexose-1-phosphate uridylyltransferase